jgi:multiple sugar transport system substrate-binding protein
MIQLRGMTWDHPRGNDPLAAVSADWARETGVEVSWSRRSLQDFESFSVEELAREYDLIVIDHPHVGQITSENCLVPLPDAPEIASGSVGASFPSYTWKGRQWAWPIDAATQVQAERPDLGGGASDWEGVARLAREGRVLIPLRPPHSLMCFFSLAGNLGRPCRNNGPGEFVDRKTGRSALEALREVAAHVDPGCYRMDPIAVFEQVSMGKTVSCVPLAYGYVSYSIAGFRANRLKFRDIPPLSSSGSVGGSALGGTGIAVSAFGNNIDEAIRFARHVSGPEIQSGSYVQAGGQAGHRAAWTDPSVDEAAGGFYSGTLATLATAYVRPRHDGYMRFQDDASNCINRALRFGEIDAALDELQRLFDATFT